MTARGLYDTDFLAWTERQAALLRAGRLAEADIGLIAEEIDSLGRGEKRELIRRLRVLLSHLHRWQYQPSHRGNSWRLSIANARDELGLHLRDNSSLSASLPQALGDARSLACRSRKFRSSAPGRCRKSWMRVTGRSRRDPHTIRPRRLTPPQPVRSYAASCLLLTRNPAMLP